MDAALLRSASVTGDAVLPVAIEQRLPASQMEPRAAPVIRPAIETAPAGPDPRVYLARELDRYPAPMTALSLNAAVGGGPAGSLRLWVSIDQAGRVIDITVIDADPPGTLEADARERLMNMRFSPAYKDDRAVKSRVQLVLSPRYAAASGGVNAAADRKQAVGLE